MRDYREVLYQGGLSVLYLALGLLFGGGHLVRWWDAWHGRRVWRGWRGAS